jgi:hypothetical protein
MTLADLVCAPGFITHFLERIGSGFFELRLGSYRGLLNAAWIGTLMALTLSFFLSLVGFYVVRGNVEQDRHTGVGQILAATPLTRLTYVFGKFASNVSVLLAMVLSWRWRGWQCS